MQTSITKLEQAADQLHLTTHSTATNGSLEEIKREIQTLKGLFLGRSQFPSIPQIPPLPPKIPSWQLEAAEVKYFFTRKERDSQFFFLEIKITFITNYY